MYVYVSVLQVGRGHCYVLLWYHSLSDNVDIVAKIVLNL